jgi:hypothetical protein
MGDVGGRQGVGIEVCEGERAPGWRAGKRTGSCLGSHVAVLSL